MGLNNLIMTDLIPNALKSLIYLVIIIMVARRIKDHSSSVFWLMGYVCLSFAMHVFQLISDGGYFADLSMGGRLHFD